MRARNIGGIFDFNDTLVDDLLISYEAIASTFSDFGIKCPPIDELYGVRRGMFVEAFQEECALIPREKIFSCYKMKYAREMLRVKRMAGVFGTLFELRRRGARLFIVSSQFKELAVPVFVRLGLLGFFEQTLWSRYPKDEALRALVLKENLDQHRSFYIGDMPTDVVSARKAGVLSIAFLNGHIRQETLLCENPDFVVKNFREIGDVMESILLKI